MEVRWDRLLGLFIEELATREVKTFSFITLTFNSTMEKPTTELANRIVVLCDFFTTKNICVLGSVEYAAKLHLHLLVSRWLTTKEQKTLEDR